jgi:hypothetical protein
VKFLPTSELELFMVEISYQRQSWNYSWWKFLTNVRVGIIHGGIIHGGIFTNARGGIIRDRIFTGARVRNIINKSS